MDGDILSEFSRADGQLPSRSISSKLAKCNFLQSEQSRSSVIVVHVMFPNAVPVQYG